MMTPSSPMRRVLVLNPNTNPAVTARIRSTALALAPEQVAITVCNPPAGPFSIEGPAHRDAAIPNVLATLRETCAAPYDAYVMACFDDLALSEARALLAAPVIGTAQAGIEAIRVRTPRFAIVTTVHSAVPTIEALLTRYGAGPQARVFAAGIGVADAAAAGDAASQRLADTVKEAIAAGAEAILLASGGLTGQAAALQTGFDIPVIDGVEAAIQRAIALAAGQP